MGIGSFFVISLIAIFSLRQFPSLVDVTAHLNEVWFNDAYTAQIVYYSGNRNIARMIPYVLMQGVMVCTSILRIC